MWDVQWGRREWALGGVVWSYWQRDVDCQLIHLHQAPNLVPRWTSRATARGREPFLGANLLAPPPPSTTTTACRLPPPTPAASPHIAVCRSKHARYKALHHSYDPESGLTPTSTVYITFPSVCCLHSWGASFACSWPGCWGAPSRERGTPRAGPTRVDLWSACRGAPPAEGHQWKRTPGRCRGRRCSCSRPRCAW